MTDEAQARTCITIDARAPAAIKRLAEIVERLELRPLPKPQSWRIQFGTPFSSRAYVGSSANAILGAVKAGSIFGSDIVTRGLTSLSVSGNATIGLVGAVANSLFTVTGSPGIGTITVTGTVSNTNFSVFAGNVASVTVGAFVSSEMLVGFPPLAGNDLTANQDRAKTPVANATLGSGGAGYSVGDVLTLQGGTFTTPAQITVTSVAVGVITGFTITNRGLYSSLPVGAAPVTGGTGVGGTFNVTGYPRSLPSPPHSSPTRGPAIRWATS